MLKKVLLVFCAIIFIISSSFVVFGINIDLNQKEDNKKYTEKEFTIKGVDGVSFSYNDEILFDGDDTGVSQEQKSINNYVIVGICIALIAYWIALLLIFEKEKPCDFTYENIDDITTLKKYNPMIAGCICDNRQALPRDIMAIILNLIKKDYIKMEMVPNIKDGKETYTYMISENKEKRGGLDKIESYVFNMIFGFYEEEKVDLNKKIKELSKRNDFLKHMNELNDLAEKELHKLGANIPRVPLNIRIFNIFLSIIIVLISVIHIVNNGINIQIYQSSLLSIFIILCCVFLIIPVIALTIHILLFLFVLLKKFIKITADRHSGQKVLQTSAVILTFIFLIIAILFVVLPSKYICLDILMIGLSILIVKTDNLMTKHNDEILNDYYALNEIKYRIEEYSLIKDEQINYMKLWEEYLIYAVAFGIPIPIVNKLNSKHQEDIDLDYLIQCESLYYICKAYLEVMWNMEFKKGTNLLSLDNLF